MKKRLAVVLGKISYRAGVEVVAIKDAHDLAIERGYSGVVLSVDGRKKMLNLYCRIRGAMLGEYQIPFDRAEGLFTLRNLAEQESSTYQVYSQARERALVSRIRAAKRYLSLGCTAAARDALDGRKKVTRAIERAEDKAVVAWQHWHRSRG